ncbi:MAG: RHS repeat-associated core domain-containing protein [Candidatus Thiodiazotropha endolucinida]
MQNRPNSLRRITTAHLVLIVFSLLFHASATAEYLCNYEDVTADPTDTFLACFWGCRADLVNNMACTAPHQANWCAQYCADAVEDVCEANPIQLSSGAKLHAETDYLGLGEFPLVLKRYYSSAWTMPDGHWGEKWLGTDFSKMVSVHADAVGDIYTVVRPDGSYIKFTWISGGGGTTQPLKPDTKETLTLYNFEGGYIWVLRLPDGTHEIYDFDLQTFTDTQRFTSKLLWKKWRGGLRHTYAYNSEDRLQTITHTNGQQLQFYYNTDGRIERVVTPDNQTYGYAYDTVGNLITVTYPGTASDAPNDTATKHYLYEDVRHPHHLTGILDEGGERFANYAYDDEGRTILSEHGQGGERVEVLGYGNRVRTRNALGKETVYNFSTSGSDAGAMRQLLSVDGEASASCVASNSSYSYDSNGFKDLIKDENDYYVDLDYDNLGQLIRRTEPLRMVGDNLQSLDETRVVEFDWLAVPAINLLAEKREPGKTTNYSYQNDRLVSRTETDTTEQTAPYSTNGNSRTWTYSYTFHDADQRQVETLTVDGPIPGDQDTAQYAFDTLGNLTSHTNPLAHVVNYSDHTPKGHPGRVIDANGLVTEMNYNELGLLVETRTLSQQGAATTRYAYHPNRLISRVTLPDDSYLSFEYNAARHLTAIVNNQGERIEYTPSLLNGDWISQTVRSGDGTITQTKQRVFDELGRVIQLLGADTQQTGYQYDPAGNRIAETEQSDVSQADTLLSHDGLKRLTTLTDPLQHLIQYEYDGQGNVSSVTDQRSNTTSYVYDGFGNLIQQASPDSGITVYYYDEAGNRIRQIDARGVETQYEYDLLNRLTAISYPADQEQNVTFTYDQGSNGLGRLTSIGDPSGVTSLGYDDRGNLVTHTHTRSGETLSLAYAYDLANNLIQQTYPSGRLVNYTRDQQGRIVAITTQAGAGAPLQEVVSGVSYQPYGPLAGLDYGNGLALAIDYDLDGRISAMETHNGILLQSQFGYDYNRVNDITGILDQVTQENQGFDYDLLHRLTQASGRYGTEGYDYDPVHNRITWQQESGITNYVYATDSNRLAEIDGSPIGHDEAGNLISQGYKTFAYAGNGRLSEVKTSGALLGNYRYDALGQRREKILGTGPQTRFVYDWQGRLVSEIRDGSVTEYLYLEQQPIAAVIGGFLGTDGDRDNDGVADSEDNCSLLANPGQVDTDGDGYGNRCDTDLNNDGVVDNTDLALFAQTYNTRAVGGRPNGRQYNPMMDFNNDQAVNPLDLWIFKVWFFSSEGPGPGAIDQTDDPQLAYIHFEHRGAPVAVSDEAGVMIWQAHYQPFGEVEELTDVDGDGEVYTFNLRYPGQYHDRESGYYYNVLRYYDPLTGRYITSDPIGLEGGLNSYLYAGSNPLLYTDPDGRISMLGMLAHPMVWGPPALMTTYWMYTHPDAARGIWDALHDESSEDGEEDSCDAQNLPDQTGKEKEELEETLKERGFTKKQRGSYDEWTAPDGSKVFVRPNGEIVRQGPKRPNPSDPHNSPGIRDRFDQNGVRIPYNPGDTSHSTGEFVK